jgi:hypothetical protein
MLDDTTRASRFSIRSLDEGITLDRGDRFVLALPRFPARGSLQSVVPLLGPDADLELHFGAEIVFERRFEPLLVGLAIEVTLGIRHPQLDAAILPCNQLAVWASMRSIPPAADCSRRRSSRRQFLFF